MSFLGPPDYLKLLHEIRRLTTQEESINFNDEQSPKSTQILKHGWNLCKGGQCQTSQENGDMTNMRFFEVILSHDTTPYPTSMLKVKGCYLEIIASMT